MIKNTKDMVFVKDINLKYIAVSEGFVKMVGKDSENDILNYNDTEIFADKNLANRYVEDDRKLLTSNKNLINYIEPLTDENGQHRYGLTSKYIIKDEFGKLIGILGITKDITSDYMLRQHYQQELKYLFELPKDVYAVSYIDIDDWRIISQRKQLIETNTLQTCYTVESLCKAAVDSIVDDKCKAAQFYNNFNKENLKRLYEDGNGNITFEYQRYLSDNKMHWIYNEVRFLVDVDSGHFCAMLMAKDIDEEKNEEQRLIEAATFDMMTKIYNRETTMEYIENILEECAADNHALIMIDVDNFKKLNDTLGHQIGDEFLISLANELKCNFGKKDIVGRVGGDEFFVLMRKISGIESVEKKLQNLLRNINAICDSYHLEGLSVSMGIAMYPENAKTLDELYKKADEALYKGKKSGKGQIKFS